MYVARGCTALGLTNAVNAYDPRDRRVPGLSADPLRELDDDPLRAADVAEPIDVFVVLHLANELTAAGSHGGDGGVDVVGCECDLRERPPSGA
jgi:hypothetical protein